MYNNRNFPGHTEGSLAATAAGFAAKFVFGALLLFSVALAGGCGPLGSNGDGGTTVIRVPASETTLPPGVEDPFGAVPPAPVPPAPPETPPGAPVPPPAAPDAPAPVPAPAEPTGGSGTDVARSQLAALRVNDDFSTQPKYDREKFRHWSDLDGNRCDSRQDVLIRQSIGGKAQVDPFGCKVVAGDWFSDYDGKTFTVPGDLDVDHVVALGEGWRAGAWQWDDARREAFANDLDSRQLVAVSAASNRSKSDKRPDQWMPPRAEFHCQYIFDWVSVKAKWDLTVAVPERDFINGVLARC